MPWAPDYLTLADARAYLRVPAADTADDLLIGSLVTAVSRAIDHRCGRQFGLSAQVTRSYPASDAVPLVDGSGWLLPTDDVPLTAPADVADDTGPLPVAAYTWWPPNAILDGRPHTGLLLPAPPSGASTVTTEFGWATQPEQVSTAARLQLGRWWVRRESPYGTAGSPADGSETRLLTRLDPDVAVALAGLSRMRVPG